MFIIFIYDRIVMAKPREKRYTAEQGGTYTFSSSNSDSDMDEFEKAVRSASSVKSEATVPEYDIDEDRVKPENTGEYGGPSKEDDVLSRTRYDQAEPFYTKKDVYADRGVKDLKSRNIFIESWSYHSLFPSMRTWSSIIALALGPFMLVMFRIPIVRSDADAMRLMLPAGIVLLFVTGVLSIYRFSVNHAFKDTLVHGIVLLTIALLYPWSEGANGFINLSVIYITSHLGAHGIDYHLERAGGRWWKLLLSVVFLTWVLLIIGYGADNLNRANVFS
jgi:hypothetical protein